LKTNTPSHSLIWFRDDLRTADNPALMAAIKADQPVICLFMLEENPNLRPLGSATRWWLHHSLRALETDLKTKGGRLILRRGDPLKILPDICKAQNVNNVSWNRRYAPCQIEIDASIKSELRAAGVECQSFNANLLNEPWTIKTGSDQPYKVFTPYWKTCRSQGHPSDPLPMPEHIVASVNNIASDDLNTWNLLPTSPDWAAEFSDYWTPGEKGAHARLDSFITNGLDRYKEGRDVPSQENTSRLSPHLRWGEISPRQIWATLRNKFGDFFSIDTEKFLAEIGWREFSKTILFYADDVANKNWKPAFDAFPWRNDPHLLTAWQKGETGYPLVDAGMRELWQTGTMHNRVRMVAASFLVKHLLTDWRNGEQWFWDTLVDADEASNPASWQWVAGSGADAAPFFRIFNPILQSQRFDPEGAYIKRWLPKLTDHSPKTIHLPGATYREPIVDHAFARERALAAYKSLNSII
jgi:deoxyribodipyrimidine photo-lyase